MGDVRWGMQMFMAHWLVLLWPGGYTARPHISVQDGLAAP